jgi:pyroglutamyl-peptidase
VDYARAGRAIRALIRRHRPSAILMFGLAPKRKRLGLEAVALNVDHSETGRRRRWRKTIGKGALALEARLPLDRLHARLRRARIPVEISHHAGTFICNHVFYVALATTRVPCGFVHVPPFREVPFRAQLRAATLIVEALGPV